MSVLLDGSHFLEDSAGAWTGQWYYVNSKDKLAALPFKYKRVSDTVPSDLLEYVSFYHPTPSKIKDRSSSSKARSGGASGSKYKSSTFSKKRARQNTGANLAAAVATSLTSLGGTAGSAGTEAGYEDKEGMNFVDGMLHANGEAPTAVVEAAAAEVAAVEAAAVEAAVSEAAAAEAAVATATAAAAYPGLKPVKLSDAHPLFGLWDGAFDVCAPKAQPGLEHTVPETFFLHSYLGTTAATAGRELGCLPADAHFSCSALRAAPVQLLPMEMMPTQLGGMGRMRSDSLALDDMVHSESAAGANANATTTAATPAPLEGGNVAKAPSTSVAAAAVKMEAVAKTAPNQEVSSVALKSEGAASVEASKTEGKTTDERETKTDAAKTPTSKAGAAVTDGSGASPLVIFVGFGRNRFGRFSLTATFNKDDQTLVAEKRYMQSKGATALRKSRKNAGTTAANGNSDPMSTRPRSSVDAHGMSLESVMPPNTKRKRVSTGYRRGSDDFAYGDDEEFYGTGAAANSTHQKSRGKSASVNHLAALAAGTDALPEEEVLDMDDDVDYRSGFYDDVSGEVYEGGWHNKRRHGRGICVYADGSMYEGPWLFGKEHGHGQLMTSDRKILYTGEWMDGLMHGQGSYNFYNGDRYQGDWREGNRHGKGEFTTRDGCKYVGDWRDNRRSGRGVFTWPDGSRYDGEWDEDGRHGKGILSLNKSFQYEGTWNRNFFDGRGSVVFPSGQKYEGSYRAGLREGRGSITFPEGAVYEGRFRDDRLDGQGTIKVSAPMAGPEDGERMIPIEIQADMRRIHLKAGFGEDPGH